MVDGATDEEEAVNKASGADVTMDEAEEVEPDEKETEGDKDAGDEEGDAAEKEDV